MRYITEDDANRHKVNRDIACIDATGSVRGMQLRYGWPKNGQVRIGGYIYNVGPVELERLRGLGIVKGEGR